MPNNKELTAEIEKLKKQLKMANSRIKTANYGIVWMDVPEVFEDDIKEKLPVLEDVKEKAIKNNDGKPTHILIEGDNYHSLTCLNFSHKKAINLIYIDPPYNTGTNGFRYKDKRVLAKYPDGSGVVKDHPLRHSYWLSFMSKRLELAYNLLKDSGVMFISINEEEYASLKLLCDKIFQESNYLTTFTVKVRHEDRILKGDKDFHETTEQLLLYRKSDKFKTIKRIQDNTSISKYVYRIEELTNNPEKMMFGNKEAEIFKPDEYRIIKTEPSKDNLQKINIRGTIKEGNSSGRFHMKYLEERKDLLGFLYKVPNIGDDPLPYRYFLTREKETLLNGSYFQGVPVGKSDIKEVPYPNFMDFEEAFNNVGYEGGVTFRNGKKPVEFIKFLINIGSQNKNAVILDFFAGSGSTGQAVLEQNNLDNGKRQFILCTNNEANIATEVTFPRIKNVMNGYQQTKNQKEILFEVPLNTKVLVNNTIILAAIEEFDSKEYRQRYDLIKKEVRKDKFVISGIIKKQKRVSGFGNSLKYYKTDFIGKNNILYATVEDKALLARKAGSLLSIAENTLEEVEQTDYFQIFENNKSVTAIYFREESDEMDLLAEKIKNINKPVSLYLIGPENESNFEMLFEQMNNVSLKAIPQPILEIYNKIYNVYR
jgi:adenine specific DNA methylase Mod